MLCGLCPRQTPKEDGGGLAFQVVSRKTTSSSTPRVVGSGRLMGLLPNFCQAGICEEMEVLISDVCILVWYVNNTLMKIH